MSGDAYSGDVYKVLTLAQWSEMQSTGFLLGAPIDLQDGFIHLSAAHQLKETVRKHFSGRGPLIALVIASDSLGDKLRWEISRGGDLFPHLYDTLSLAQVKETFALSVDADGSHVFPAGPWDKPTA